MKIFTKLSGFFLAIFISAFLLTHTALATEEQNGAYSGNFAQFKNKEKNIPPQNCIATDLKGYFVHSGNHESGTPVIGNFENIAIDPNCPNEVTIHIFGSMHPEFEKDGWLESQNHVNSETHVIPAGEKMEIKVDVPLEHYCWYQVEATRTRKVEVPPYYYGEKMIDYVFVKGKGCESKPTPTITEAPKIIPTSTSTPAPIKEVKKEIVTIEKVKVVSKPEEQKPKPVVKGVTTLAPTGYDKLVLIGLAASGITTMGVTMRYGKKKKQS